MGDYVGPLLTGFDLRSIRSCRGFSAYLVPARATTTAIT
jgi:hypothetical protein